MHILYAQERRERPSIEELTAELDTAIKLAKKTSSVEYRKLKALKKTFSVEMLIEYAIAKQEPTTIDDVIAIKAQTLNFI